MKLSTFSYVISHLDFFFCEMPRKVFADFYGTVIYMAFFMVISFFVYFYYVKMHIA